MVRRYLGILLVLFTSLGFSTAQNINPDYHSVIVQFELTKIELTMDESDKHALVYPADPKQDIYYKAQIHLKNTKLDTLFGPVGIRIRGNTSRGNQKKSFKIDFKEFGGEQLKQLKKLNLKPNNNDPSMLRESLSWIMYRKMNVPAARTGFVELYMNDEFMGVYQNIENIDDEFVNRRYGNEAGNLYKCTWGATLETQNDVYDNHLFELKTNEEFNMRSRLKEFISIVNSTGGEKWEQQVEAIFDVDNYMRQLAVESMIGHWDGYSYNTNNYYLYDDPETGKFHFIPYDLDNTWGIDWIGPDWGNQDLMAWYSDRLKVPLTTRLLKSDKYHDLYVLYLYEAMDRMLETSTVIASLFEVIETKVADDSYYSLDFGFTYQDFLVAQNEAWGKHVEYSINDYIETRLKSAQTQTPEINSTPIAYFETGKEQLLVFPNPSNGFSINYRGIENMDEIRLFDSSGKVLPGETDVFGVISFKNRLEKGMYFLKSGTFVGKFIVAY
ncbi:MAG: CotH kinase family protein [Prolixibacteraceae bacterium]